MAETTHSGASHQALRDDLRELAWDRNACLPARSPLSGCRACAEACPVDALTVTSDGVSDVSDACVRCGRCAAACPTGALRVTGFAVAGIEVSRNDAATETTRGVDCWRVPHADSPTGAVRVPCLGGLDSGTIASLQAQSGGPVHLLDRGWCADCPANDHRDGPPVTRALAIAREALRGAGVAEDDLPAVETRHLDPTRAAPTIPTPLEEQRIGRRQFFRRALGLAARTAEDMQPPTETLAERQRVERLSAPHRQRLIAALDALGSDLPSTLSPAAAIDPDACHNHRICAALCPTGALRAVDTDTGSGIDFDPASCIQCGLCERACPQQAIQITPRGGVTGAITRHHTAVCTECQRRFAAGTPDEHVCPACRRDRAWFTARPAAVGGVTATSEENS